MSIKARLCKLETTRSEVVVVADKDKETNKHAYQRCINQVKKPKTIIYASELDILL